MRSTRAPALLRRSGTMPASNAAVCVVALAVLALCGAQGVGAASAFKFDADSKDNGLEGLQALGNLFAGLGGGSRGGGGGGGDGSAVAGGGSFCEFQCSEGITPKPRPYVVTREAACLRMWVLVPVCLGSRWWCCGRLQWARATEQRVRPGGPQDGHGAGRS